MEENENEIELKGKAPHCPIIDVNGVIEKGNQFDLDIILPEDNRDVIFGTVKDVFKEPVKNAVVKLIEIGCGKDGSKKRIPISHEFTNKNGEFVFGPICPNKKYSIDIWVSNVHHYNMEIKCKHEGDCIK